ncbi:hypothetical protein M997_0102 [Proteus hauseri ATCC 700826]|uniref:Uncharacterized protein n=1 Tax=Proteus hauseri ATCC 700826 TaxID=1354271 RepID=A0AAJ3LV95_PROHU|nr:hypothetical protein [Proteus hauseri]OAT51037.1 hypothetical protein M997_0102 [Proteus hauseri ATCC 700826]
MPIHSGISNSPSLRFLKTHSSTSQYEITSLRKFFIRIKDEFLALFNSNHKFTSLENKTVAEFNLTMMVKDVVTFIKNTDLNDNSKKDNANYVNYAFAYLLTQSKIQVNLYNIYHSGDSEPNELLTQLINYINNADKNSLDQTEYIQLAKKGMKEIADDFINIKPPTPEAKDDDNTIEKRSEQFISLQKKIAAIAMEVKNN